jgi:hypothetical protein
LSGKQAIPASDPLVPDNVNGAIQAVVGNAHAVADAVAHPVAKPLAVIGAAKAATTENVTKVANALDSVNSLHISGLSKGSESPHVRSPLGCEQCIVTSLTLLEFWVSTAGFYGRSASPEDTRIDIIAVFNLTWGAYNEGQ